MFLKLKTVKVTFSIYKNTYNTVKTMPLTIYAGGAMFQHSRDGVNDEQYQVMSTKWTYIFMAHFHKPIK